MLLLLAGCHQRATVVSDLPKPTPQAASQTGAEARRDGVPAPVAALPLDERTKLDVVDSPSVTTDEGVWILARPSVVADYGEVLLLDQRREHVIKAFPLPHAPPFYLAVSDRAVYCASQVSALCRIDRKTRVLKVVHDAGLTVDDLRADDHAVWAKDAHGTWTKLDPETLAVVARATEGPSG